MDPSIKNCDYIYSTPLKREKAQNIPSTPKKTKEDRTEEEIPIKGKNLLSLFESL